MNGLMRKFDYERYFEQIKMMPEPIMTSELPKVKLNLKGIREYAKSKEVAIASLTEFEVKLRNEMTQKSIAKECADWIRHKAILKSNVTSENMNGFTTVDIGCDRDMTFYQGQGVYRKIGGFFYFCIYWWWAWRRCVPNLGSGTSG